MKITVLSENTSKAGFLCEHGLSLLIELENEKILFDFGASDLFYKNATALGVDLSDVDFAFLSHGHNDHGGGAMKFFEVNREAPLYVRVGAFDSFCNASDKDLSLDMRILDTSRVIFTKNGQKISPSSSVIYFDEAQRTHPLLTFGLQKSVNGKKSSDDFEHEEYLLIEENGKRVLLSGCSHKGIYDIAKQVKPTHIVGGFHTSKIDEEGALEKIASSLNTLKTEYYTCHCTGTRQYEILNSHSSKIKYISAGDVIEI
jgi:7,8-dihydropterin-6-yl-methyl-4-(beta-D-ribofuranosyl)aminobenzene 5'-phosphate synthase